MEKQVFKSFEELGQLLSHPEKDEKRETLPAIWDTPDLVCRKLNHIIRKSFAGMGLKCKKLLVGKDTYILHTGNKQYWTIIVRIVGKRIIYAVSPYAALDFHWDKELLWTQCEEENSLGRAVSLWDKSRKGIKDQSVMDWKTFGDSVSVKSGWGLRKYSAY